MLEGSEVDAPLKWIKKDKKKKKSFNSRKEQRIRKSKRVEEGSGDRGQ